MYAASPRAQLHMLHVQDRAAHSPYTAATDVCALRRLRGQVMRNSIDSRSRSSATDAAPALGCSNQSCSSGANIPGTRSAAPPYAAVTIVGLDTQDTPGVHATGKHGRVLSLESGSVTVTSRSSISHRHHRLSLNGIPSPQQHGVGCDEVCVFGFTRTSAPPPPQQQQQQSPPGGSPAAAPSNTAAAPSSPPPTSQPSPLRSTGSSHRGVAESAYMLQVAEPPHNFTPPADATESSTSPHPHAAGAEAASANDDADGSGETSPSTWWRAKESSSSSGSSGAEASFEYPVKNELTRYHYSTTEVVRTGDGDATVPSMDAPPASASSSSP
ncbi:hypothetical protein NESM_000617600 [Novymonas esmeraldas]|uniref:Uncharacterized protein n=1 Tax=Novymonas esmeraldas TaxID=1808958 RepID=A0AAW0ETB8_9TRYP